MEGHKAHDIQPQCHADTGGVGGCGELDTNPSKGECWPIFAESSDFLKE